MNIQEHHINISEIKNQGALGDGSVYVTLNSLSTWFSRGKNSIAFYGAMIK